LREEYIVLGLILYNSNYVSGTLKRLLLSLLLLGCRLSIYRVEPIDGEEKREQKRAKRESKTMRKNETNRNWRKQRTAKSKKRRKTTTQKPHILSEDVGLQIKVQEEREQGARVDHVHPEHGGHLWQTATVEIVGALEHKTHELQQLELREVGLPRARQAEGAQEVVAVHEHVDQRVEHRRPVG
jgi:hypothetical protein